MTQSAVAWVLGSVFVRFCEDNGLFGGVCYRAGPEKDRAVLAEESQDDYFRQHRGKTDRDWLLASFEHIGGTQAGRLLFDPEHNPAYRIRGVGAGTGCGGAALDGGEPCGGRGGGRADAGAVVRC
ncbi:hypothetical protein [Plantactinospora soyae]|uniref:Uncharacterized protein n=1 Tax=Plantactinospora soyae TaxID=1544732 RepID=A0A927R425_9ACTN|nr:hypothetical protein [Plantactinospora soyae]MBE1492388.1 hypothetical protein [Plantactinospora soyae]